MAFDWETLDDLKGLRIGDKIGNMGAGEAFLAAEKSGELTVERVPTDEQNLKKLLAGRIDAMVGTPMGIQAILKAMFSPEEQARIVAHPKPLRDVRAYAVFNKQFSPQLIQTFNDGIRQLRESGQYDQWFSEALQQ